ncbi:SDR family oxidoreductase [Rhodococcus sp. D2-41]|uniref:NAD(P)-dependent oxidoreductase n=1 Tax=Speluncibacter jeojiensis TaxID=2710754 RepID=UPI0024109015|nr:NAD(P)-binding oxidoreductase [Rhodococcus sp. D2-41]MDG3010141.1 SDR family oxidoreductase [Rhodococcus sp. D2-41]
MKIALLGATGNVGSRTLTEAVAAGHEVVAYARRPEAVKVLPGVTVVEGALEDQAALADAIRGCDALIVAVTGPMKDTSFAQRTVPTVVKASQEAGVGRLVLVSAFGAGDTANKASVFAKLAYRTILRGFFDDKAKSEAAVTGSDLDWTIVYPVNLKDAATAADWTAIPLEQVDKVPGLPTLPFGNVAKTLVELAADRKSSGGRIVVTTAKGRR